MSERQPWQKEPFGTEYWSVRKPKGDERWKAEAACRGAPSALFFPERGDPGKTSIVKLYCEKCPVRQQCFEYGANERYGIWGGYNLKERRQEKRRRQLGQIRDQSIGYRQSKNT